RHLHQPQDHRRRNHRPRRRSRDERPMTAEQADRYLPAALDYANAGLAVFLLGRTKRPVANCPRCPSGAPGHDPAACACLTCHGCYAATTDPDRIRAMFHAIPHGLLAMRTGAASGRLVLDIDPRNGGRVDPALMVPTATVATGGGGRDPPHPHPARAAGGPQSGPARGGGTDRRGPGGAKLSGHPGVDVKADGGYVLAPPSIHPGTGRAYWWVGGHPLAAMPPALVAACRPPVPAAAVTITPRATTTQGAGGIS